jgi:hypothetical protein
MYDLYKFDPLPDASNAENGDMSELGCEAASAKAFLRLLTIAVLAALGPKGPPKAGGVWRMASFSWRRTT